MAHVNGAPNGVKPIRRLLVANRGEIARRIFRTAHAMGYGTCLVGFAVEALARAPEVGRSLGLAKGQRIHAVVAVGRSAERFHEVTGRLHVEPRWVDGASS